ncbi:hypothetical protein Taro_010876, partial [Colocasia esculenta]|nr:hypothetical protein [Colocasia esculenta]
KSKTEDQWAKANKAIYKKFEKEIKLIRQFQMYNDYCFVNGLPEVQLGQCRATITQLRTENPVNVPLQVDFASLKMPDILFLPKLHFLLMDSNVESERFLNSEWCKVYHEAAIHLDQMNSSLAQSNQPNLTPEQFMDLNSINLLVDPYSIWFGTAGFYKSSLSNQEYTKFIEEERLYHIKRLIYIDFHVKAHNDY